MGLNEKLGPRVTGLIGASSFASAFGLAALATNIHSLPLLYAGYGLLGGFTVGCAYVNPISNLMKWYVTCRPLAQQPDVMTCHIV
jgi:OFA family oxalate/formate antiporter-like MFS transporter